MSIAQTGWVRICSSLRGQTMTSQAHLQGAVGVQEQESVSVRIILEQSHNDNFSLSSQHMPLVTFLLSSKQHKSVVSLSFFDWVAFCSCH